MIASVSKYSFSESATKAFAEAGVPMVGTIGVSTEDYLNPSVFPISAGAAPSGGAGSALQAAGAKTVAFISADNPAGRYVPNFIKPVLESPSDLINETYIPLDASVDITPFMARVVRANPDGVVIAQSTDGTIKVVTGLRQAGYQGKIAVAGVSPEAVEKMGAAADGLIVVSAFEAPSNTENETIKQFNTEMDAHDEDAAKDEFSLNAWLTVHFVADQLERPREDRRGVAAGRVERAPRGRSRCGPAVQDRDRRHLPRAAERTESDRAVPEGRGRRRGEGQRVRRPRRDRRAVARSALDDHR